MKSIFLLSFVLISSMIANADDEVARCEGKYGSAVIKQYANESDGDIRYKMYIWNTAGHAFLQKGFQGNESTPYGTIGASGMGRVFSTWTLLYENVFPTTKPEKDPDGEPVTSKEFNFMVSISARDKTVRILGQIFDNRRNESKPLQMQAAYQEWNFNDCTINTSIVK